MLSALHFVYCSDLGSFFFPVSNQIFLPTRLQWEERWEHAKVAGFLLLTTSTNYCWHKNIMPLFSSLSHHGIILTQLSPKRKCWCLSSNTFQLLFWSLQKQPSNWAAQGGGSGEKGDKVSRRKMAVSHKNNEDRMQGAEMRCLINKGISIMDANKTHR